MRARRLLRINPMLTAAACPPRGARTYAALALLLLSLASPGGSAGADDGASAEGILADLNAAIQWFRDVRVTLRGVRGAVGMPLSGDEEALARQALERAFAVARAKAALLRSASAPAAATEEQRAVDARAQVQQAIRAGEA